MANSDKNIVITPNIGQTDDPKIVFSGANTSVTAQDISVYAYPTDNGTLSFEGSAGQLFSITNSLTGTIFSVNDISGIPSIEVDDTGTIRLAEFAGNVLIGTATDNGTDKLQVDGSGLFAGGDLTYSVSSTPSLTLGVNTTAAGTLKLWGGTAASYGLIQQTTNNLHIDSIGGETYLNFYDGNAVRFGNGAGGVVAVMGPDGDLWKGSDDNTGSRYFHDTYHPNADTWTTARTLTLSGAVTGSVSIDGSGNVTLATTATSDPTLTLTGDATGAATFTNLGNASLAVTVDQIDGVAFRNTNNTGPVNADTLNQAGHTYYNSGVTNFSGNATDGALYSQIYDTGWQHQIAGDYRSGRIAVRGKNNGTWQGWQSVYSDNYHPNADTWTAARTISLGGDLTGSVAIDGSSNVTLTATAIPGIMNEGAITGGTTWASIANNAVTRASWLAVAGSTSTDRPANDAGTFAYNYGIGLSINKANQGVLQMYAPEQDGVASGGMFYRSGWNGTIRSWQRLYDDEYKPLADAWTTARTLTLSGAVTGSVSIDGSGNVTLATTATSDPVLTLAGDATGSATFTNLGNATLTVAVVDDSHNHSINTISDEHRLFNNMGDNHSTRTDFNAAYDFGWRFIQGTTNGPGVNGATNYYSVYAGLGNEYLYNTYGMQIAYPRNVTNPYPTIRYREASTWGAWQKISAGQADTLTTARTINGVSFDGSANITVADATKLPLAGGTMTGTFTLGQQKINFHSGAGGTTFGANHYSMGVDIANGSWSGSNYSDLIIGYHTGIRIGAGYSGIRFYNNSPTTDANNDGNGDGVETLLMTIGGGGTPTSGANVTVTNQLNAATFNATSTTGGGFQGIDADSATIPSFTWTSDQNTGMWHAAADQIGFTTAGTNQMTITTTGVTAVGTVTADTFNATSTTNGGFQGIDADSLTAPSFTWTSDLNTGMWHRGADQIGFSAGGNDEFFITTTYTQSLGSSRAPIFYDSNDTAYYVDPNNLPGNGSTSAGARLRDLRVDRIWQGVPAHSGPILTYTLTSGGSGYVDGTYVNQVLSGGQGVYATFDFTVAGGVVTVATLTEKGSGFQIGNTIAIPALGGTGSGGLITVNSVRTVDVSLYNTASRIRLASSDTSLAANQEIGGIYFNARDASNGGGGDKAYILGVAAGTSGGGEIQFWTSSNAGSPTLCATVGGANDFRLYNTAGTFYHSFSNNPTANRTLTLPDAAGTIALTTSSITGNAATATALQTARTIGGVSFNGTANINLPGVNTAGNQSTSGNAATATALQTARTINGVSFNGTANITVPGSDSTKLPLAGGTMTGLLVGLASAATDVNTANDLGSFSVRSNGAGGVASISFHRPGVYATNMGLGTDNIFRIGGWSASNNCLQLSGTGDLTILNTVTAATFNATSATNGGFQGIAADSAANPSFTWTGDLDTGIYRSGTNQVAVTCGGTNELTITTTTATFAGNVVSNSDIRLKKDIEKIDFALSKVKALNGVNFTKIKNGDRSTGLIAQDVQAILPEAVTVDENGYLSVAYGNMVGLLVEAIKEQDNKINTMRTEIEDLKTLVKQLMETR